MEFNNKLNIGTNNILISRILTKIFEGNQLIKITFFFFQIHLLTYKPKYLKNVQENYKTDHT